MGTPGSGMAVSFSAPALLTKILKSGATVTNRSWHARPSAAVSPSPPYPIASAVRHLQKYGNISMNRNSLVPYRSETVNVRNCTFYCCEILSSYQSCRAVRNCTRLHNVPSIYETMQTCQNAADFLEPDSI